MNIILGITGSISAYKSVEIMRLFQKNNHRVCVILTKAAQKLITPLTFATFAPGRVYTGMFAENQDPLLHINLSRDNDLLLIAPASANMIGKMANGIADDLLSTTFIAFYKRVVIAPAMNSYMLENKAVVENLSRLKSRGAAVIEPEAGSLACSTEGRGRLPAAEKIYEFCLKLENA
ncbi:MAG: phosphopantothenoylcysteine decarboxylase [Candidatus Aminicenantes bacterium]|jgi:phosphopantothenoylcysteine decarboxylase/phosphopantothenate--cysteine ligase|nr:phosphopantothenoylcysteine decarboxylase [Candidatus Aminicenantes bacterium]